MNGNYNVSTGATRTSMSGNYDSSYNSSYNAKQKSRGRPGAKSPLSYYFLPKQRLNTLFAVHSIMSLFIGTVGYFNPSSAMLFFSAENDREMGLARVLSRLYCSLIFAQGIMIWRARRINDGEIKRAFVLAYFICFLASTLALVMEHLSDEGIVDGKFFGVTKIAAMLGLTAGYGWFTFFQPPTVFALASHY